MGVRSLWAAMAHGVISLLRFQAENSCGYRACELRMRVRKPFLMRKRPNRPFFGDFF
jgi:hypothetical protein